MRYAQNSFLNAVTYMEQKFKILIRDFLHDVEDLKTAVAEIICKKGISGNQKYHILCHAASIF